MVSTTVAGLITDLTGNAQDSLILFSVILLATAVLILRLPAAVVNR